MTTVSTVAAVVMTPLLVKALVGALVPVDPKGLFLSTIQVSHPAQQASQLCETPDYNTGTDTGLSAGIFNNAHNVRLTPLRLRLCSPQARVLSAWYMAFSGATRGHNHQT